MLRLPREERVINLYNELLNDDEDVKDIIFRLTKKGIIKYGI